MAVPHPEDVWVTLSPLLPWLGCHPLIEHLTRLIPIRPLQSYAGACCDLPCAARNYVHCNDAGLSHFALCQSPSWFQHSTFDRDLPLLHDRGQHRHLSTGHRRRHRHCCNLHPRRAPLALQVLLRLLLRRLLLQQRQQIAAACPAPRDGSKPS